MQSKEQNKENKVVSSTIQMMKSYCLLASLTCIFSTLGGSAAAFSISCRSSSHTSLSTEQHRIISPLSKSFGRHGNRLCNKLSMSSLGKVDSEVAVKSPRTFTSRKIGQIITGAGLLLVLTTTQAAIAQTSAATAPTLLPPMHKILLACILPTTLGFYKSEYGVSYGYGTAMAASSYLILSSISESAGLPLASPFVSTKPAVILSALSTTINNLRTLLPASLPAFHAFSTFFYGSRLNLFLLYRELCLPRFRAMRERIEERAKKQGSRLKRAPFLISCAFLYFCMVCPILVTTKCCQGMSMSCATGLGGDLASILEQSLRLSMILTLSGFLLGAVGDLNKSIGKMLKGEDSLITGGVFRFFRHPNYTGEVIGWLSSCMSAFLAVALKAVTDTTSSGGLHVWKNSLGLLSLSVMGAIGISFVLGTATAGLEYRQKEKYGDTEEYQQWVKKSWVGFKMRKQKATESEEE